MDTETAWVPQACTLPTAEQPLRVAEFDELFATSLRRLDRTEATCLKMQLDPTPDVAARTADLGMRETGCCSFFTFTLVATGGELQLDITVPVTQTAVLYALQARAATAAGVAT
jgi:hypothetical protein